MNGIYCTTARACARERPPAKKREKKLLKIKTVNADKCPSKFLNPQKNLNTSPGAISECPASKADKENRVSPLSKLLPAFLLFGGERPGQPFVWMRRTFMGQRDKHKVMRPTLQSCVGLRADTLLDNI
jgi:hypothetical protein